jgi:hypothetical protein
MGYRNYLGSLPKREYNKIKKFSLKELYEYKNEEWSDDPYNKPGHVGVYDIAYNEHYELGKYIDSFDKKFFKPVFKNKETQKHYVEEHDFFVVQKEFVEELINDYSEKVKNRYKELLNPFFSEKGDVISDFLKKENSPITEEERKQIYLLISHVKDMAMEWGVTSFLKNILPYDLEGENLISSWKYEYEIFELVRLYKTFDWKRNVMIYYGY